MREHRRITRLLNLLLAGATKSLPERRDAAAEVKWVQEDYFANFGEAVAEELSPPIGQRLDELESERYYAEVRHDGRELCVPHDLDDLICRYQKLRPPSQAKFDRATYWLSMARRQWEDSMSASYASLVSAAKALTTEGSSKHNVYCEQCKEIRSHDVPGATEKFRAFFEKYGPGSGLRERRSKMYGLRSKILHGSDLMQLDQGRAFGWDPPWRDEEETNKELWTLMRIAARNWLSDPRSD